MPQPVQLSETRMWRPNHCSMRCSSTPSRERKRSNPPGIRRVHRMDGKRHDEPVVGSQADGSPALRRMACTVLPDVSRYSASCRPIRSVPPVPLNQTNVMREPVPLDMMPSVCAYTASSVYAHRPDMYCCLSRPGCITRMHDTDFVGSFAWIFIRWDNGTVAPVQECNVGRRR